eukprot:TRINITY_DN10139_c0_g1_i1.p1 TRINITY_DN10139_c0_g1~~TRINITY_DN10139_c0_g1_i1.p1  ORF type:complete len:696 (+),score=138.45 TRINITY_DN10139_c0_g1_i1:89-2089(+)
MAWLLNAALGRTAVIVSGKEVVQGDLLADGGFAYVYRGSDASTGEELAIRKVLLHDQDAVAANRNEMQMLRELKPHPNIVKFLAGDILNVTDAGPCGESTLRHGQVAVSLFEFCSGGTLLGCLEKAVAKNLAGKPTATGPTQQYCCPCLAEADAISVLRSTAAALAQLHSQGIIHYDVKSENLMLGSDGLWKLGDFGSASKKTFDLTDADKQMQFQAADFVHGRCTPIYRAPEIADTHLRWIIGPKVDLFALGCVFFATLTGQHPFPMDSTLGNINAKFSIPKEASAAYSPALLSWVKSLLARAPEQRPAADAVVNCIEQFLATGKNLLEPVEARKRESSPESKGVAASSSTTAASSSDAQISAPAWTADFSFATAVPVSGAGAEAIPAASGQAPAPQIAQDAWVADFSAFAPAAPANPVQAAVLPKAALDEQPAEPAARAGQQASTSSFGLDRTIPAAASSPGFEDSPARPTETPTTSHNLEAQAPTQRTEPAALPLAVLAEPPRCTEAREAEEQPIQPAASPVAANVDNEPSPAAPLATGHSEATHVQATQEAAPHCDSSAAVDQALGSEQAAPSVKTPHAVVEHVQLREENEHKHRPLEDQPSKEQQVKVSEVVLEAKPGPTPQDATAVEETKAAPTPATQAGEPRKRGRRFPCFCGRIRVLD